MEIDVRDYIGIPFAAHGRDRAGCDCWGLVRLIYAERLGVVLPSYAGDYADPKEEAEIAVLIRGQLPAWRRVDFELPGDVALLRIRKEPMHVGLVVRPRWMIHILNGIDACLERYDAPVWRRRIVGFYRHGA